MYNEQLLISIQEIVIIMEVERTELEEEYFSKIVGIWNGSKSISTKIKRSMKVVDSIDKIKWSKEIPANLTKFAEISLKAALLQAVEENLLKEFHGFPNSDVKDIFRDVTRQNNKRMY